MHKNIFIKKGFEEKDLKGWMFLNALAWFTSVFVLCVIIIFSFPYMRSHSLGFVVRMEGGDSLTNYIPPANTLNCNCNKDSCYYQPIMPFKYGSIVTSQRHVYSTSTPIVASIPTKEGDSMYGHLTQKGQEVTEFKYTYPYLFHEKGVAKVKIDKKVGLINHAGEQLLPIKYADIRILPNHFILLKKEGTGLE